MDMRFLSGIHRAEYIDERAGCHSSDFATQIHPIFAARCVPCHNGDKPPYELSFASRERALKGGTSGPACKPDDSKDSLMILKVTHQKGSPMPPIGKPLSSEQVALLETWIDEDAPWAREHCVSNGPAT